MRMLDLFSGIGGFSLAAEWVWEDELDIVGFCEIEKYAQKVLQKNFPGVPIYEDIKKLDGKDFKNIDLLTGGFPCQDISVAGKGAGLEEGKRSSLWFEMHRIIREVRPRYALIENVPMLTVRGGTRVIADLAEIGYDSSWTIIGADDVGAWHRRKRIWIVAYLPNTDKQRLERHRGECELGESGEEVKISRGGNVPDPKSKSITRFNNKNISNKEQRKFRGGSGRKRKPDYWNAEPNVGRVANGVPSRVDRLKGLGNAIVPQVAQIIMERIKDKGGIKQC